MTVTETRSNAPERTSTAKNIGGLTLETDHGVTTISDDVVSKVAGYACREVEGVANLGGQFRRLVGRVKPGSESLTQGVNVEVGTKEAAIDLVMVVRFGFPIPDLAQTVRENVIAKVESATGLTVVEVNLEVDDVVFEEAEESRVA